jgi:hypothetical protein
MTYEEMMAWTLGAGAALWAGNALRLKIANHVIDKVIKDYEPQLQAFEALQPLKRKAPTPEQATAFANFQTAHKNNDILVKNAEELKIPLPEATPEVLSSAENFQAYVDKLTSMIHQGLKGDLALPLAYDVMSDAILNEALLRAFPEAAKIAGAGEMSDFILGTHLKELLDRTGIIDQTASLLVDMTHIVSEQTLVSVLETTADPHMAVFSLFSIANRERKMIMAGHATPGESLTYGLLDYGGRIAGGALGLKAGAAAGAHFFTAETTALGGIIGWVVGCVAAKSIWRSALKKEIGTLTDEYKDVAGKARTDLELKKKAVLEKADAVAKETFGAYKNIVESCPDLKSRDDVGEQAEKFRVAFDIDIERARNFVESERRAIVNSVRKPGFFSRMLGADWKKAMEQRTAQIAKIHENEIDAVIKTLPFTQNPSAMLAAAAGIPAIEGGLSEKIYTMLPEAMTEILGNHRQEVLSWKLSCRETWKKAANATLGTLNEQQEILTRAYEEIKKDLEYRQRRIFSKGQRLAMD